MTIDDLAAGLMDVLPKYGVCLSINHNDHKGTHCSVEDHLGWCQATDDGFLSPEDRAACIATNELWEIQWYPATPIGFCKAYGSTLANALRAAQG